MRRAGLVGGLVGVLLLASCQPPLTIDFEKPRPPPASQAAEGPIASFDCFEASTDAERLVCHEPALAALDLAMGREFHRDLRDSDLFGRDILLAGQRLWLTRRELCRDSACLEQAYRDRIAALTAWTRTALPLEAIGQSVPFKPLMQQDAALCGQIAASPDRATSDAVTATGNGRPVTVLSQDANVFGGYQHRARAVSVGGTEVLNGRSLGDLVRAQGINHGGRFSAFASQTGDYGAIRIFRLHGETLALLMDPVGYYAPAAAGEFAHAGVWSLDEANPRPLCLFQTFHAPPEHGVFDALPAFSAWRARLRAIAEAGTGALGVTALRDQSQLRAETEWMLVNTPLAVRAQAEAGRWTPWLRHRHDLALDALLAWSRSDPANKAAFDRLFALLRPAAQELVTAFQQTEGLTAEEAREAGALAVMEFTYGAAARLSPGLGSDVDAGSGPPFHAILDAPG